MLIETRSIPRSGLHYMKSVFKKVLEDDFYFCEWYNEPGCCRTSPCRLGFQVNCGSKFSIMMVKSHDFDLLDSVHTPPEKSIRLILIRDPIFVLTSWYALHCLHYNSNLLKSHGIHIPRVFYKHEKMLSNNAHSIIANRGRFPNQQEATTFVAQKARYMIDFAKKWGSVLKEGESSKTHLIYYENVHDEVIKILLDNKDYLYQDQLIRLEEVSKKNNFNNRNDPWHMPTQELNNHIKIISGVFQEWSEKIIKNDRYNIFKVPG